MLEKEKKIKNTAYHVSHFFFSHLCYQNLL